MKQETLEERIKYISFLHKQNLNGRETEDELFEAGILAGIEETEVPPTKEISYSDDDVYKLLDLFRRYSYSHGASEKELKQWFEQFKKK
jgi:hypothetical protein